MDVRTTTYAVALTEGQRVHLRSLIGAGTAPARLLTRARILLKANQGEGGPAWTGAAEAHVVALACSDPPAGRERWTLRRLADALVRLEAVSRGTVRRTVKQTR